MLVAKRQLSSMLAASGRGIVQQPDPHYQDPLLLMCICRACLTCSGTTTVPLIWALLAPVACSMGVPCTMHTNMHTPAQVVTDTSPFGVTHP